MFWWWLKWKYLWPARAALWWQWEKFWLENGRPEFLQCPRYYYNPDLLDPALWRCYRARWHPGHHV